MTNPTPNTKTSTPVTAVPPVDTSAQAQKRAAVEMAMKQITKQFGTESIMTLGQKKDKSKNIPVIPTGSIAVDLALGIGGLPLGRIVEIYGPEASGKTTLCLHIIANAQKMGMTAAFIDAEHALDPKRAEAIGVDLNSLIVSQPDNGEQALEIVETLVRSGGVGVVVIDSVAALVPRLEIEGEMGDAVMGAQARLMSQAMRKLTGAIQKTNTLTIFTNQIRMKIGVMFGNPETTTGGQALKFYSSIRLDCRKLKPITKGEEIIGSRHKVKVVKNKLASPYKIAEVEIMHDSGISSESSLIDVAVEFEILQKAGAFYKYNDKTIGQGKEAVKAYLKENQDTFKDIEKKVWEEINKGGKAIPVEVGETSDEDGE